MTSRRKWNKADMLNAVTAVQEKKLGYKRAARLYSVPRATLKDYVKSPQDAIEKLKTKLGRPSTLPPHVEDELKKYCLQMDSHFYGLTAGDLSRMAYELAIRNNLPNPFSKDTKKAGRKWIRLFFKRHPELSMRKPQNLSMARIQGFSKTNVDYFFKILAPQLEKIQFDATRVFNVDESGISVVQHKSSRIVTAKAKKEVHKLASAERGATITTIFCMSATGQYVPPLLIFPQKKWEVELLDGAPEGSIGGCSDSGWITTELFAKWFEHFIEKTAPSKERPVVLVLDGHHSHTRNIYVIERAREVGVLIVCLPPHSTAKMQPLDVAFMAPFKTYYAQAIENWLSNHPGRIVRKLQIATLLGEAYLKAATMQTAVNGFRKTGIFPLNPNCFDDSDFLAHEQETRQANQREESPTTTPRQEVRPESAIISPTDIRSVPVIEPSTSARRGSALLVTGSPHKEKIQQAEEKKKKMNSKATTKKKSAPKRKLSSSETSGKSSKRNDSASQPRAKTRKTDSSSDSECKSDEDILYVSTDDEDSDDDVECPLCQQNFSGDQGGEKWVRCTKCFKWLHEDCSSVPIKKKFVCDFCVE